MSAKAAPIILIVDDYPDNRALLSACLRGEGYEVVEAGDGLECLREANRSTPDLILMDLAMPGLDGVEAARQIRQRDVLARTPIFAISAYATREVKADALAAGCAEVFVKPLDLESLMQKIRSTLGPEQVSSVKQPASKPTIH
jgi:CheY-like chemotaxis protein